MINGIQSARRRLMALPGSLFTGEGERSTVSTAIADAYFPFNFFARNIESLRTETWWVKLSEQEQREHALRILLERCRFFLENRAWVADSPEWAGMLYRHAAEIEANLTSGFCSNCGWCCETASGLPDYPPDSRIPAEWKAVFGNGLGKGHRFCPFLWQAGESGRSLCSIHPWRANPCRIFGSDDCEFVMSAPEYTDPEVGEKLVHACTWLAGLIDR